MYRAGVLLPLQSRDYRLSISTLHTILYIDNPLITYQHVSPGTPALSPVTSKLWQ